jgi:ribosomal protein S18 acetylase RimI-like enzyme
MLKDTVVKQGHAQDESQRRGLRRLDAPPLSRPRSSVPAAFIRPARPADLAAIIALDARVTGLPKQEYWSDQLARRVRRRGVPPFFLVATSSEAGAALLGFVLGEVRAWEFGSEPCGWVCAIAVDPQARQTGLGAALLDAITLRFRDCGVGKVRTMVARDDRLLLLFFRAAGMTTGPYLELAKDIGS